MFFEYKARFHPVAFFLCLLFLLSGALYANDDDPPGACGGADVVNALKGFKIDPGITTNGPLIDALTRRYGPALTEALQDAHPILRHADKPIDIETLRWVVDKFLLAEDKGVDRVFMSPFNHVDSRFGSIHMVNLMVSESWPDATNVPMFISADQLKWTKERWERNDYNLPALLFGDMYGIDLETGRMMAKKLHEKIFVQQRYHFGLSSLGENNRRITFIGHGSPGGDALTNGRVEAHFNEIIDTMMESGLPPKSNLEIMACYGACGKLEDHLKTGLSVDELKQAFIDGTLINHLGNMEDSFGYKFSKMLFEKYPDFDGSVTAYNGLVRFLPIQAWVRDPLNPSQLVEKLTFAIGLKSKDDPPQTVWFDIEEMNKVYKKADFAT